jgi:hypothetical protein
MLDVSAGGAQIVASEPIESLQQVQIEFTLPLSGDRARVTAVVVREAPMKSGHGYGLMFIESPEQTRAELVTYAAHVAATAGGALAVKSKRLQSVAQRLRARAASVKREPHNQEESKTRRRRVNSRNASEVPEWARNINLRELYQDALKSVRNMPDSGAANKSPDKPPPSTRTKR